MPFYGEFQTRIVPSKLPVTMLDFSICGVNPQLCRHTYRLKSPLPEEQQLTGGLRSSSAKDVAHIVKISSEASIADNVSTLSQIKHYSTEISAIRAAAALAEAAAAAGSFIG